MTKSVQKQLLRDLKLPTNTCEVVAWIPIPSAANSKSCYENNPRIGCCNTQFKIF